MVFDSKIKGQLLEYISNPAVLVDKNDAPYEYREGGSINRLKRRRQNKDMPLELFSFVIESGIAKTQIQEFASGCILNYVETSKIYN